MIDRIVLRAGSSDGRSGLSFDLSPLTIFVGPNNSGKSKALLEIESCIRQAQFPQCDVIERVEFSPWVKSDFELEIAKYTVKPRVGESLPHDHVIVEKFHPQENTPVRSTFHLPSLVSEAISPNSRQRPNYCNYLSLNTLRLDGRSRLSLVDEKPSGDMILPPTNHLARLFKDSLSRLELRRIVSEAFGKFLVIDPNHLGYFRVRLSHRPPSTDAEEQGWNEESRSFHEKATLISSASDGVKAFVGILATLIAGDPYVTLIDEPEAFLHPTLAARLGKEVTLTMGSSSRRLFVSTHSASFLMGCILGGSSVNIVRLTFDGIKATARLLSQSRLVPLMRNPLLRSIGVLNALFYNAVVVTEADADRAFYQEVNERLLAARDPRGVEDCLFLNAQNKQTIWDIVGPLRELGIPAAGIVDIDVLKDGGAVWNKPMHGAHIPAITQNSLNSTRQSLLKAFESSGRDMKREGGIKILKGAESEACASFFTQLAEYGVFVVPIGEVESWLGDLEDLGRSKTVWLSNVFKRMGEDPEGDDYVRPSAGDVWEFIGQVASWVKNPSRRGIPDHESHGAAETGTF